MLLVLVVILYILYTFPYNYYTIYITGKDKRLMSKLNPKLKYNGNRKYQYSSDMERAFNNWYNKRKTITINDKRGNEIECTPPMFYSRVILDGLGFNDMSSITPYTNGDYDDETNTFSQVLARIRKLCELDQLEGSSIGLYNDRMIRLNLMSNYGFTEKSENKTTGEVIHRPQTMDELQEQYRQLLLDE